MRKTIFILSLIFVGSFAANMCQCPCPSEESDDISFGWGDGTGRVVDTRPSSDDRSYRDYRRDNNTSTGTNTSAKPSTNTTSTKPSTNTTSTKPSTNTTTTKPITNTTAKPSTNTTSTKPTTGSNTTTNTGANTSTKPTNTSTSTSTSTNTGKNTSTSSNTGTSSGTSSSTSSSSSTSTSGFSKVCLDVHNQERARLNIPLLVWDTTLAKAAQSWADTIADNQELDHSPNRNHVGENTARRSYKSNVDSASLLIGQWLEEKQYFKKGNYPNISTTGNIHDVGHYSQMIWAKTTKLGCGMARGGSRDYLVCQYGESGNRSGKPVY